MEHVTLTSVRLAFHVETVHGYYAQFVLQRAKDRTNVDYYDKLKDMLDTALSECSYAEVNEVDYYYKVIIIIDIDGVENIPHIQRVCNDTVAKWKARFNVNRMLGVDCE